MLISPEVTLDQYAVSFQSGFLPSIPPLQLLNDPYYWPWEDIVLDLPNHIESRTIRLAVDALPVLSTSRLCSEPEWRRAYSLLAFLTHAYIWGGERPEETLPPAISRPFLEVSKHLELPPCATYAALNLWNFSLKDHATDITDPDNLYINTSFTGTKDEEWFFMISVALEAKGATLIPSILQAIHAVSVDESQRLCDLLAQFSSGLCELRDLLERMYEHCAPAFFFHQLRPLLAGSKNMASAGLPNGVFYDEGHGQGEWHQYSGGSNAQSSLIQTFDIFLGVEHTATGDMKSNGVTRPAAKPGFMQEMRNYMPGPHRRFLEHLSQTSTIRTYALSHKADSPVRDAYNTAVMSLGRFRDSHVQMVTRYIILAAKTKNPKTALQPAQVNLATTTSTQMRDMNDKVASGLHGTGGTDLIPFLRKTRDTTKAAASYVD